MGATKRRKLDEPFTEIPNRLLRSQVLNVYDKMVFCIIASCNPSYPTYATIRKWTGLSKDRIWKSLQRLESCDVIWRIKRGRAVEYVTWYNVPSDGTIDGQLVRYTDRIGPPDGTITVRNTETKKNKEKEQEKGLSEISEIGAEELSAAIMENLCEQELVSSVELTRDVLASPGKLLGSIMAVSA